jgi:formylglycine-generating enzyme required for sulfatase activity
MAPEQLTGAAHIDRRADVYSLGVVLYEALAGRLPFESEHRSDLSRMILAGESPRLRRLVRELPRPLDSIVHKAIDVDPAHRYASAEEFAADLQRFGEGRPVLARDVGIGVRTRRWVRHHPVAATTISLLAVILVISASLTGALATKVREFSLLSGFVAYGQTVADESGLYPAIPKRADDMERWLRDGCDPLLQMRPELEDALQDLRARALPTTAADLETDRVTHPAFARLQRLEQRLAPMHRAQRIREGEPLVVPTLTETQLAIPARDLYALAHDRVVPDLDDRRILGEEPLGLAFARLLVEKGATFAQRYAYMDILAWALFANGQDAAAVEESNAALAEATAKGKALERAEYRENLRLLERAIASAPDELARMELEHKQLLATVTTRRTFRFASRADQFLHDHLAELITNLDALASDRVQVEQRLRWARQISSLTRAHPNAHCSWDTARKAIAQSEKYRGLGIELADEDVLGLVPIGMNPETKLWEFYDLRSAWDGKVDPATIPIPTHEPDGSIAVTEDTGIVFVLLPGGTSWMGAQAKSQELPNHDSDSGDIDSLQQVTLAPFFLARHETTQGQWARMWTWDDSRRYPSNRPVGKKAASHLITAANPVEFVSWEMCVTLLSRYDLRLPTEAQWEYACRAGTTGAWCCAKEELRLYANVRDQSAGLAWGGDVDAWDDGYAAHWPVGTGHANEFGLHDMHGNVWEWCQDGMANFSEARRQGDGLSLAGNRDARIHRGGCFDNSSMWARSAYRRADQPAFRGPGVGVRAARALRP